MLGTELSSLQISINTWKEEVNQFSEGKNTVADELSRTLCENDRLLGQVRKLMFMRDIERQGRQKQEHRAFELEKALEAQFRDSGSHEKASKSTEHDGLPGALAPTSSDQAAGSDTTETGVAEDHDTIVVYTGP